MNAAKVIVKLHYIDWRGGRPRYVPGPGHRPLGLTGRDLRHPDGRWFNLLETEAYSNEIRAEAKARREGAAKTVMLKPQWYSVADLFDDLWRQPRYQKPGTTRMKTAAPDTVRFYRSMAEILRNFDNELWASPAAAVSRKVAHGLYKRVYAAKGLHTARGVIAVCRVAWGWGCNEGPLEVNPFMQLNMETPKGRLRVASVAEIRHFVATCDAQGRPELGDMILLGVFSAQRQKDRLKASFADIQERFEIQQSKTGKKIKAALPAFVLARFQQARQRRLSHKHKWPQLVIDEKAIRPWKADHYRHIFAELRDVAAATMPSLAGFTDLDLRDTALTWARQGGADFETRRALSGHSADAAAMEEKSYTGLAGSVGDAAVNAIVAKWEKG